MSGASSLPATPTEPDLSGLSLSHDLRAPLRVIDGFARILKEDYGAVLDRRGNDHVDRILAATQRMGHMIDVLMGLAQIGSQPMQRRAVDLSALARQILDDLTQSEPQRKVTFDIEPGWVRWGDPDMLTRVMENLLGNAWKYSSRAPQAHIVFKGVPHADGPTAFQVIDNGVGFDMRLVGQLFGPFQRLHSASEFPGHGVGLVTVKRIIERHGGQVGARSEPGQGSVFWFTLAERATDKMTMDRVHDQADGPPPAGA